MFSRVVLLTVALCAALMTHPALARANGDADEHFDNVDIFVLTFGPGDHPFSKFGHNAVLVVDATRPDKLVYNFGTFRAQSPTLLTDFLQGRLLYWVSVGKEASTLAAYARDNRSIVAQKLRLTRREKRKLVKRLAMSAQPSHRYYRYDYYLNNCSTKVRDLLNEVLDSRLATAKHLPAMLNWRQHTSRLTQDSFWTNLGLNLLLARGVDRRNSRWEEMFLPSVLQAQLASVKRPDGKPLVEKQEVWFEAHRPPAARTPRSFAPTLLVVGCLLGALFVGLGVLGQRLPLARSALLSLTGLLGVAAGLFGCIFVFFWLFTDHSVTHGNENLLLFPPWALALPVTAFGTALSPRAWRRRLWRVCVVIELGSAADLALKLVPSPTQDNWMFLALALPMWGGLTIAFSRSLERFGVSNPKSRALREPNLTPSPLRKPRPGT